MILGSIEAIVSLVLAVISLTISTYSMKQAYNETKQEVKEDVSKLNEKQKELAEISIQQYTIKNIVPILVSFVTKLFYLFLILALIIIIGLYIMSFLEPENRAFYSENISMIVSIVTLFSIIFAYHEFVNRKKD